MSSHHSKRFFNLHHQQVTEAKERHQSRYEERLSSFLFGRSLIQAKVQSDFFCVAAFTILCFVYINMASIAYLSYLT